MKHLIRKLKDEQIRIESRSEDAIKLLKTIIYKQKPNHNDIVKIQEAIKLLDN